MYIADIHIVDLYFTMWLSVIQDPVTRAINGIGWSVMSDKESVQKAIQYFNSGEVIMYIYLEKVGICKF